MYLLVCQCFVGLSIIMSNYTKAKQIITLITCSKNLFSSKVISCDKQCSGCPQMTNLRTDEIVLFRNSTKISTDENKASSSICQYCNTSIRVNKILFKTIMK